MTLDWRRLGPLLLALLALSAVAAALVQPPSSAETLTIGVGQEPFRIAVDTNAGRVYVVNNGGTQANPLSTVSVLDTLSNTLVSTFTAGNNSRDVAVDPSLNPVYVANSWSNSISVFNASTDTLVHTIQIGKTPRCSGLCSGNPELVAVDPTTHLVYAVNAGSGNTSVIDGRSYKVVGVIPVGYNPGGIVVDPGDRTVIIGASSALGIPSLTFVDELNNSARATIPLCHYIGNCIGGVALDPLRHRVYVTTYDPPRSPASQLSVIDTSTLKYVQNITVGTHPEGVGVDEFRNFAFVANAVDDTVSIVNASDFTSQTIQVGQNPQGVAVDASAGVVYVANYASANVSAIREPGTIIALTTTQTTTSILTVSTTATQVSTTTQVSTATRATTATFLSTFFQTKTSTETTVQVSTVESAADRGYQFAALVSGAVAIAAVAALTVALTRQRHNVSKA